MFSGCRSKVTLLNSFNVDATSIQHVSTRLKGWGGGGVGDGFNVAVQQNRRMGGSRLT